ncbi:MAG TPA: PrgI family protein [Thermotogota bacterium]|nr:PrgI family protein [Thermotogota bacterium]
MAYVPVPKDLNAVKTKVMFNLTKRQLICFGGGAAVAVPLFFLCKTFMDKSVAAIIMVIVLLPFMLLAMYEKNGQPLEKVVRNIVQVCFLRPKQRPYMTNNYYAVLERQENLDKEVYRIVNKNQVHESRKKANPSCNRKSEKSR